MIALVPADSAAPIPAAGKPLVGSWKFMTQPAPPPQDALQPFGTLTNIQSLLVVVLYISARGEHSTPAVPRFRVVPLRSLHDAAGVKANLVQDRVVLKRGFSTDVEVTARDGPRVIGIVKGSDMHILVAEAKTTGVQTGAAWTAKYWPAPHRQEKGKW